MSQDSPQRPRRFAPVPIETTYASVRKPQHQQDEEPNEQQQQQQPKQQQQKPPRIGPNPEPTPESSPRSQSPALHPLNRQPTQKRKFAPQLIETSRRSRRVGDDGPATKPTDKTDITPYTKNIYTASLQKHHHHNHNNNSHKRWPWDGQGNENRPARPHHPNRRETEDEHVRKNLLEIAAKAAERQIQEDALAVFPNSRPREGGVAHFYFQESSSSDEISEQEAQTLPSRHRRKSSNLGINWWHKHMQEHAKETQAGAQGAGDAMEVDVEPTDSELDRMDFESPPDALWTTSKKASRDEPQKTATPGTPTAEADKTPPAPAVQPVERGWQGGPFGQPFGAVAPEKQAPVRPKLESPPMLGEDLVFRQLPSPKATRLAVDLPFAEKIKAKKHRDDMEKHGLWRGYCYRGGSSDTYIVPSGYADLIRTPGPEAGQLMGDYFSAEPSSTLAAKPSLHNLQGVDSRLMEIEARREKYERIEREFSDDFVTQVYNYLSLGYPAMARDYDEELSKISKVDVVELASQDNAYLAKGYMLHRTIEDSSEARACPRWRALRLYITEWAKQHPDLDDLDPLAWGVRERRGSWGN